MKIGDIKNQLKLAFYEKDGNEFEKFVVSAYKISYPELLAIKPQGQKGDGANDGYQSGHLVIQVYAPERVDAQEAIKKMNHDFKRAIESGWDFNEWHFVVNDKFKAIPRDIHHAIDTLKQNNQHYSIKLIDSDSLKNRIINLLPNNRLRVSILLNANKDISEFSDFEAVEKVIEAIASEQSIRAMHINAFMNFAKESFLPDGIKKLEINIDDTEIFKFFGSHLEKSQEVMEEFIPQIGLDIFSDIGKYIQQEYQKFAKSMKPEIALMKTYESIYTKLEDDANLQTALWVVIAYFFDICDIGKIE
ncbi:MAG TPA: hypothetical protein ENK75_05805 [Saprospiraceae bacterium]|nr:hypothetical protein [Saprospiraceae bacterium]